MPQTPNSPLYCTTFSPGTAQYLLLSREDEVQRPAPARCQQISPCTAQSFPPSRPRTFPCPLRKMYNTPHCLLPPNHRLYCATFSPRTASYLLLSRVEDVQHPPLSAAIELTFVLHNLLSWHMPVPSLVPRGGCATLALPAAPEHSAPKGVLLSLHVHAVRSVCLLGLHVQAVHTLVLPMPHWHSCNRTTFSTVILCCQGVGLVVHQTVKCVNGQQARAAVPGSSLLGRSGNTNPEFCGASSKALPRHPCHSPSAEYDLCPPRAHAASQPGACVRASACV